MRRVAKSLVLSLALAGVAVAAPAAAQQPAPAQGFADAPAHFQRALELYGEQDFAGALVEFRRAYELAPSYKMLFNIGQVCYQLTDYACAMRSFEQYMKEGGSAVSTERRQEVEKEIAKLRSRVGHLEIVTNVPGVEITIDDVAVGKTPLPSSVVVSTGKRRVVGTREGYSPVSRIVEVAGTDSSRIELVFASQSGGVSERRYESRWNTYSWIGLGVTAALAAAGTVSGIVALNESSTLKDERFAGTQLTPAMTSAQDSAETFSLVSDLCFGGAILAFGGTLAYTFLHTPKVVEQPPPATEKDKSARSAPKPTFAFGVSPQGATIGGRF